MNHLRCPECGMGVPGHVLSCSRCPTAVLGVRSPDAASTARPTERGAVEGFAWPEPKVLPVPNGQKLNPARVEAAFRLIHDELILGEQLQIVEMILDGTDLVISEVPATDQAAEVERLTGALELLKREANETNRNRFAQRVWEVCNRALKGIADYGA